MKSESEITVGIDGAGAILHCKSGTVRNRVKNDPSFPRPIKIGRANCWYVSELRAYVAACASRRVPGDAAERVAA